MAGLGSDKGNSKSILLFAAVGLATALIGYGCAGIVSATSSKSSSSTPPPNPGGSSQAQLVVSPTTATFQNVMAGSSSSQLITISNTGTAQATISQVNVSGAGFSVTGLNLPAYVPNGQQVSFSIVFSPSAAGNMNGSISVVSDAPNSPLLISADGSAVVSQTPLLTSTASNLDFGSVLVGGNRTLGVTLTNAGTVDVSISGLTVTGPGFTATGISSGMVLTPGQSAPANVTFAPQASGSVTGAIAINSNAPTVTITLLGVGGTASSHAVALTWDPSTSGVTGYNVYRAPADGSAAYEKLNTVVQSGTQYTDSNILSGQDYVYAVTAVDSDGVESDYSDPAVADVP